MRIYLYGDGPAVDALKQLLVTSGHELVDDLALAEVVLLGPPRNHRVETSIELVALAPRLPGPIMFSLVSFEPNLHWPANFCHTSEGTLRGHTGHRCPFTRTHFRTPLPERSSELLLGADPEAAKDALLAVWQPCLDQTLPRPTDVYAAEAIAEPVLLNPGVVP